ncbi:hypothetical protein RND81_08G156700 [Saponaria officinalis]|uniref:Choline transporter-like protein n=1 Tax=Saponaria officinalis TaxID=3572 RepID=A0AAW1J8Q8_SAPOF
MQVEEERIAIEKPKITGKILVILFYMQLVLVALLAVVLIIRGFISSRVKHRDFHPLDWYPPMLTAVGLSGIAGFTWQIMAQCRPSNAIKLAFWLGPLLTCAMGVLLICTGSSSGLGCGVLSIFVSVVQSLYACWASPRFEHATAVLAVSIGSQRLKSILLTGVVMVISVGYCGVLVSGIGGATSTGTQIDRVQIAVILLSMSWTLQVIRNVLQVTGSRVRHVNFSSGDETDMDTCTAFKDVFRHSMGSVCTGSILVPIVTLIRGSARAVNLIAGDSDEFLFSCTDCYSGVASRLVTCANRWGFVHVGVYGKGIVRASSDTWEMFRTGGMEALIDSDLTSSFCFFCGVAVGALSALAGGSWALVVHKDYATEICVYGFLVGYFMSRVSIAWPQACVSAYHVAFAENPQSARFDATIPVRLEKLYRNQA